MSLPRLLLLCLCLAALPLAAVPAEEPASRAVDPLVSLRGKMTVGKALTEIRRQCGITVRDDRNQRQQEVSLDLERASFWEAVDALALAAKAKIARTGTDGAVSLVRLAPEDRRPPISHDGPFRTRILRVTTSRDLDSPRGSCTVELEVTWTPTLRPLFVESKAQQVRLQNGDGADVPVVDEGGSFADVDGRSSLNLEVNLPALPRSQTHIGRLEGKLRAIAPSKMLRFDFDADLATLAEAAPGGAQRRLVQEEVVCRLARIVLARDRWSLQVGVDYPTGNRSLESFQQGSLVANNELTLKSKDGKRTLWPTGYAIDRVNSRRALVTYHFTDRPGSPRGRATDWKVGYLAPARIIELPFGFSFRRVPLP